MEQTTKQYLNIIQEWTDKDILEVSQNFHKFQERILSKKGNSENIFAQAYLERIQKSSLSQDSSLTSENGYCILLANL